MFRPVLAALAAAVVVPPAAAADPFEFKDGDRVVLLGSTLVEREQKYGYWELALTLKNKDKAVTFRNLGWSGDTVWGEARNAFDQSPKGFERLVSLTLELKPTVVVVCYGHNESFDGKAGVEKFTAQLERLLDALAPTGARFVLMTPTPFLPAGPLADPAPRNNALLRYLEAVKAVAGKRQLDVVDLYAGVDRLRFEPSAGAAELSDDGLHLTPAGYRATARLLARGDTARAPGGLRAAGSPAGEQLRAKIVEKNRLFFHRWRPENETYLFGFRKHEQGKNAKEVAEFDPLVDAAEKEIGSLREQVKGQK